MKKQDRDFQAHQAKAILKRAEQESEKTLGAKPFDPDSVEDDAVVILGKKIGRGIGYVVVLFLIWHLASTYIVK